MTGTRPETWTTAQAALIVGKPLDVFEKLVERAPVKPALLPRGKRRIRAFAFQDLVFLSALDDLKQGLTAEMQAALYRALTQAENPDVLRRVEVGRLTYDFDPYVRRVQAQIEAADETFGSIDRAGGDPVIRGTTIEVYRIAALLDGMSVDEILKDYPSLDERQVLAAKAYAAANPKLGRPYPKITGKKAMRAARADDPDTFLPPRA